MSHKFILRNLIVINPLCMIATTFGWVITVSHQPSDTSFTRILHNGPAITFLTVWVVTLSALLACHSIHVTHNHRYAERHWAGMPPQGIFILKVLSSAMLIFVVGACLNGQPITPHLTLTVGLPALSASTLLTVLWDRPVQVQVGL